MLSIAKCSTGRIIAGKTNSAKLCGPSRSSVFEIARCTGMKPIPPVANVLLLCSLAVIAGGCETQLRVATPAPRLYVQAAPAADVFVEVRAYEPPPPLPVYDQPPCPEEGFLWVPGYWHYATVGYYWVPGTWVRPPRVGVVWTPGYWGYLRGAYVFNAGYWGPHVGFYGGINYGYGYGGVGFAGGRWVGNAFAYNRSVTNVSVTIVHHTYNETVINNINVNNVSFNGGTGGVTAMPTPDERRASREPHAALTTMQREHIQQAAQNPLLLAKSNGGRPTIAATPRPAAFAQPGVVGARGAGEPGPVAHERASQETSRPQAVARLQSAQQQPIATRALMPDAATPERIDRGQPKAAQELPPRTNVQRQNARRQGSSINKAAAKPASKQRRRKPGQVKKDAADHDR